MQTTIETVEYLVITADDLVVCNFDTFEEADAVADYEDGDFVTRITRTVFVTKEGVEVSIENDVQQIAEEYADVLDRPTLMDEFLNDLMQGASIK